MSTKLYRNTGVKTLNVLGVGEIKPGDQISVTTEYQPTVILANYPGLVDLTDPNYIEDPAASEIAQPQTENKPKVEEEPLK